MKRFDTDKVAATPAFPTVRAAPIRVADNGNLKMGYTSPAFPPVRATPASVADNGNIKMGYTSPVFPLVRSR